jgi:hypothetical protein
MRYVVKVAFGCQNLFKMASVFTVQLPLLSSYTTGGSGLASNSLGGGKQQQQNPQPAGSSFKKFHPTLGMRIYSPPPIAL